MNKEEKSNLFSAIGLALHLGFSIAIPLAGFIWLGNYLDKKFNCFPLFLILFLIFGLYFVFFEIYNFVLPFLKKKK